MYNVDTHNFDGCILHIYVCFCNYDNNVDVFMFFSNDIIVFPLCTTEGGKTVIKFVFIFVF